MKAIVQDRYGSEDVLELRDIAMPEVGDDGVLVKVRAAGVHIGDWHVMTGLPYMLRAIGFGLRAPKVRVRGMDVAGTVVAAGNSVTGFKVGDHVFGTCEGSFAEYAVAREDGLALKPANLTFELAAAVPTSAFAALQAVRDAGNVHLGSDILIAGASGGVGLFAIQIARAYGATITGVCGPSKTDLVRSLGATDVVDYTREDFSRTGRRYDVVIDLGGNRSLADLRRVLRPGGTLVLAGGEGGGRWLGSTDRWIQALALSPFVKDKLTMLGTKPNKADLLVIRDLLEAGTVAPVVDRAYPLSEVSAAIRCLREGRARGKLVISVSEAPEVQTSETAVPALAAS